MYFVTVQCNIVSFSIIMTIVCMLTEAARRAVKQADSEDCDTVDIEHFEKILPQLVSLMFMHVLDVSVGCFFFVSLIILITNYLW